MPSPSTLTNAWKSESLLMPAQHKSDLAEQMKALRRKTAAAKNAPADAQPKAENTLTTKKKTCLCSPTTHPGSFRCRLHRAVEGQHHALATSVAKENSSGPSTPDLNFKGAGGNTSPAKLSRFCGSR